MNPLTGAGIATCARAVAKGSGHGAVLPGVATFTTLIGPDPKHSIDKDQKWIIGESDNGVLVVVFTKRLAGKIYRLISARKASRRGRSRDASYEAPPHHRTSRRDRYK